MNELTTAVLDLAAQTATLSDADLDQPWAWGPHDEEGARFALIGAYHELRDLAVQLRTRRAASGPPYTAVWHLLAQHHLAFRDMQAVLLGVPDELLEQPPGPGDWPVRRVLAHMFNAQRTFFTLVHYAIRRQREGGELPKALPKGETERVTGGNADFEALVGEESIAAIMAQFALFHQRALVEFADISDAELAGPSPWWEQIDYDLHHRLHRFDAHLRQHTIQVEKTLAALGQTPTEAQRLLRLVVQALAEVEGGLLGALDLGAAEQQALAAALTARTAAVLERINQANQLIKAVTTGDETRVNELLTGEPALANARTTSGLSAVLAGSYYRQQTAVKALLAAGPELSVHDAATVGNLEEVQAWVNYNKEYANAFARDGFTPLQLACFFGQEAVALWLIAQAADVKAVAQNDIHIQPIHAAVNAGIVPIVTALLAAGADVNATQANDFTPLQGAADNGQMELVQLLLAHGADANARSGDGNTARDLAENKGHTAIVQVLDTAIKDR